MSHLLDVLTPTKNQQARGFNGFIIFQSDYACSSETILVIPCTAAAANMDLGKVTPKFDLIGIQALAIIPKIAGLAPRDFQSIIIGTAMEIRNDLIAALDLLVTEF